MTAPRNAKKHSKSLAQQQFIFIFNTLYAICYNLFTIEFHILHILFCFLKCNFQEGAREKLWGRCREPWSGAKIRSNLVRAYAGLGALLLPHQARRDEMWHATLNLSQSRTVISHEKTAQWIIAKGNQKEQGHGRR